MHVVIQSAAQRLTGAQPSTGAIPRSTENRAEGSAGSSARGRPGKAATTATGITMKTGADIATNVAADTVEGPRLSTASVDGTDIPGTTAAGGAASIIDGDHWTGEGGNTGEAATVGGGPDSDGVVVVTVAGDIDLYTGPQLRDQLRALMIDVSAPQTNTSDVDARHDAPRVESHEETEQRVRAVVIDLLQVSFMDSYALGVLVWSHKTARRHGLVTALVADSPIFRKLFQITGLERVMPLHPDLSCALDAVNR